MNNSLTVATIVAQLLLVRQYNRALSFADFPLQINVLQK